MYIWFSLIFPKHHSTDTLNDVRIPLICICGCVRFAPWYAAIKWDMSAYPLSAYMQYWFSLPSCKSRIRLLISLSLTILMSWWRPANGPNKSMISPSGADNPITIIKTNWYQSIIDIAMASLEHNVSWNPRLCSLSRPSLHIVVT